MSPENEIAYLDYPEPSGPSTIGTSSDIYLHRSHKKVSNLASRIGRCVALNPVYFITVPLIVSVIMISGLLEITFEKDTEYLFTSASDRALYERLLIERFFSNADVDVSRRTRLDFTIGIIVSIQEGGNLQESVDQVQQMVSGILVEWNNKTFAFEDVCLIQKGECLSTVTFKRGKNSGSKRDGEWFSYQTGKSLVSINGNETESASGTAMVEYWLKPDEEYRER